MLKIRNVLHFQLIRITWIIAMIDDKKINNASNRFTLNKSASFPSWNDLKPNLSSFGRLIKPCIFTTFSIFNRRNSDDSHLTCIVWRRIALEDTLVSMKNVLILLKTVSEPISRVLGDWENCPNFWKFLAVNLVITNYLLALESWDSTGECNFSLRFEWYHLEVRTTSIARDAHVVRPSKPMVRPSKRFR